MTDHKRCPTCGRSVSSVFDHVDQNCGTWPDREDDADSAKVATALLRSAQDLLLCIDEPSDGAVSAVRELKRIDRARSVIEWASYVTASH